MFSFVGSRFLSSSFAPSVSAVLSVVASSSSPVSVGCCTGLDSFVLEAALAGVVPVSAVSCFAAFGSSGVGVVPVSAGYSVFRFAAAGGSVSWFAGGGGHVPARARLVARSRAVVSASPSGCVVFLASPRASGSLVAASFAASRGVPVFVFCCGFAPALLPPLSVRAGGSWVSASFAGFPCLSWAPQPSLF